MLQSYNNFLIRHKIRQSDIVFLKRFNVKNKISLSLQCKKKQMNQQEITKEEINLLPTAVFEGKIIVIDNTSSLKKAMRALDKEEKVGFDTETRPAFEKGVRHKVSLVQIATNDVCYLFRLNILNGIPKILADFLNSTKCKKIGLSLRDDFLMLNRHEKLNQESFIDLQKIVGNYGIESLSLQKIFALLFKQKISKYQRLTNWEAATLTAAQKRYAATDAWATLKIYEFISKMDKIETFNKHLSP